MTQPVHVGPSIADQDIEWALADLKARAPSYKTARDYVAGRQKLAFASEKFLSAFGGLFGATPTNLMPITIDAVADRLIVSGFDGPEDDDSSADPEDTPPGQAWALWEDNRMDRGAGQVHQEALTCGDSFVMVWPDDLGVTRVWLQQAEQIALRWDENAWNTLGLAAKCWTPLLPDPITRKLRVRLTLYYPDRIERYITRASRSTEEPPTKASEFEPFTGDAHGWMTPNPYGQVPFFHFGNNARAGDYGRSELADLIAVQDKFNKTTADMLVAMEFAAYPQRYAIGYEPETDDITGKPRADQLKPGVDRFLTFASELVKVGQFSAADLQQFTQVLNTFREEVAIVSGLPLHYLMPIGRYPSGEAIKMAEGRLVAKVNDRQIAFGQTWTDLATFALRIDTGTAPEGLTTVWKASETRNDLLEAQVQIVKQQLGVSKEQSLIELGYSAEDVEDMLAQDAQANAALAQLTAAITPPPAPGAVPSSTGANPDPNVPVPPMT